ncbi:MAG: transposase [Candidatus Zixiibacteriota bacterium]
MSKLKRYSSLSKIYFITNVTYNRAPILIDSFSILWEAFTRTNQKYDFDLIAWSILPDHFHVLIDSKEANISKIMQSIKMSFGEMYRRRMSLSSGQVWQRRFWDHIIRNQEDFNRHLDYIHYNPVKHGYIDAPLTWEYSSIQKYKSYYPPDWGVFEDLQFEDNFGE